MIISLPIRSLIIECSDGEVNVTEWLQLNTCLKLITCMHQTWTVLWRQWNKTICWNIFKILSVAVCWGQQVFWFYTKVSEKKTVCERIRIFIRERKKIYNLLKWYFKLFNK